MQNQGNSNIKKYEKPMAKQYPLRPVEAILGSCKTAVTAAPTASPCHRIPGPCNAAGS